MDIPPSSPVVGLLVVVARVTILCNLLDIKEGLSSYYLQTVLLVSYYGHSTGLRISY